MKRRLDGEEHVNHERWAIPYADLMTLLLAFFVVMYAVSVVNEGKYRVMSESIIEAFHGNSRAMTPPAGEETPRVAPPNPPTARPGTAGVPIPAPIPLRPMPRGNAAERQPAADSPQQQNLRRIEDQVQQAMRPLIDRNLIAVRRNENWLEIEIRTDILFPSGTAQVHPSAQAVLDQLAGILAGFDNPLRIEGYTDDKPINTAVYPSNWELSAARAATVARLFAEHGVDPKRLGIIGWGEYRPTADNATAEGRNRNRRVLVVVLSDDKAPARFYSAAQTAADGAAGKAGGAAAAADRAEATPGATAPPAITVTASPQGEGGRR
ncbi:MAG: flagellar motor protein MotD [Fulvimonas sp.]|nr:flagellar motor protein MotD [Fulvimonas sp.]